MVDLKKQYLNIKDEVDEAVLDCISSTRYIGGPKVEGFKRDLESFLDVKHVIPCANGTDALQIALMALGLKPGDEVIVPSFTYVATAEVIALLRLKPIMVDVDPDSFCITPQIFESAINPKVKAVVPVHLFGQCADMGGIMEIASAHGIKVVEDNAQAIGAYFTDSSGQRKRAGTIGDIGCTSFFPSKNLGCFGDGGAMFTNDDELATSLKMIANHGQEIKYYHSVVGCNSRLDAIQAAVLGIKLKHLKKYSEARISVADYYDAAFKDIQELTTPYRSPFSTHVFHQYTLKVAGGKRDALRQFLQEKGIPSMIYYPVPLYKQKAYAQFFNGNELPVTEALSDSVLSLPIHTEMDEDTLVYITGAVRDFFSA